MFSSTETKRSLSCDPCLPLPTCLQLDVSDDKALVHFKYFILVTISWFISHYDIILAS